MKPIPSIKRWLASTSAFSDAANISSFAALSGLIIFGASTSNAADIQWEGTTASYTTATDWQGDRVPTVDDNAFADNGGTVQILPTDPTWHVNDYRASNGTFVQSGSRVEMWAWMRMGVNEGTTGTFEMTGGKHEHNGGSFHIGERGNGIMNLSGGSIYFRGQYAIVGNRGEGPNTTGTGVVNQSGGKFNGTGELWVGHAHVGDGVFGTYNMTGGTLNLGNWFSIGRAGGDGEFVLTDGTINKSQENSNGSQMVLGIHDGGIGSSGHFKQDGGTLKSGSELWVSQGANVADNGAKGTYDMNGGVIDINNWIAVGRQGGQGTMNINGGTIRKFGGGGSFTLTGTGTVNHTGGLVDIRAGSLMVGEVALSTGVYNLQGTGVVEVPQTIVVVNGDTNITGTLNMGPGGTLKTGRLFKQGASASSPATVTFDDTTLIATANEANFISGFNTAEIRAGGLRLDTNGFNVATPQLFTVNGGTLTKNGRGTLGFTGSTSMDLVDIKAGLLDVDGTMSANTITVADNAGISGTGTIGGNIDLGVTSGAYLLANSNDATPLSVQGDINVNGARIDFANHGIPKNVPITVATSTQSVFNSFTLGRAGNVAIDFEAIPLTVKVTFTEDNKPVTWTGSTNKTWDIFSTKNWVNASNVASSFSQSDTVNLGNAAGGTAPIVIKGPVRPAVINVDNTNTITLQGTAADDIAGSVVLTKAGAGKLVIDLDTSLNANQTTPTAVPSTVTVNAGELQVGNGGTVGSLGLASIVNNALLSFNHSGPKTLPNPISGTGGSIAKAGAGNLKLTGAVSYTGTTTISAGRLTFQTPAVPGTGAITN
ncbi:MAG: hypothetical protein EOP85_02515, partial [Verrucomicrobiaceae bacterium]